MASLDNAQPAEGTLNQNKRPAAGGRKRDPSRSCFEPAGEKRIKCLYCGHTMASNTPAERARSHILSCAGAVPPDVLAAVRSASNTAPELASGSTSGKRKRASLVGSHSTIKEMIDHAEFESMVNAMTAHDQEREKVIKRSRDIQKNAKQAIFSLHRGDFEKATQQLRQCEEAVDQLEVTFISNPDLKHGAFSSAMEEYAEARIFKTFLCEMRLLPHREIRVTRDEYLGGVLDFTGELNRYCIAMATGRDVGAVKCCRDICEGLMAVFLQFDFRNGALRKKFDSLKYTLKKMENTLYELSLAGSGNVGKSKAVDNEEAPAVEQRSLVKDGDDDL